MAVHEEPNAAAKIWSQSGLTTVNQETGPMLSIESHCVREKNPSQPRKERLPSSATRRKICRRCRCCEAIPLVSSSKFLVAPRVESPEEERPNKCKVQSRKSASTSRVAQWSRDLEEETAMPSALHNEYAPRSIPQLYILMGHPDGSEIRNARRQYNVLN